LFGLSAIPAIRKETQGGAMIKRALIRETFELWWDISCHHFVMETFYRDDPVLKGMNPDDRLRFLENWWEAGRNRMWASYLEQVSECRISELLDRRKGYIEMLDSIGTLQWQQEKKRESAFQEILDGASGADNHPNDQSKTRDTGRKM